MTRPLMAEVIGTALLVATVVGSGIMAETLAGGNVAIALLANTLATGCILVVLILVLGPISGAHFNPAVSMAFALRGSIGPLRALCYVAAQITGALLGTLLAHAMFAVDLFQVSSHARGGSAQWLSEMIATFALVATILALVRSRPDAVAYAVGLVVMAGYWYTASTSFANPAVAIGRAFTETFSGIAPADVPGFIAAQLIGAAAAVAAIGWITRQDTHAHG
jgi:glycerol uptake facilitator-like aquaporin